MKKLTPFLFTILLAISVSACSSPEEKAADYVDNGNSLSQQGELEKAEIEYRNALQINQNLPDAWYGLAKIHERRQEWRKAYAALLKIRDVNPQHLDGRVMLGQLQLASNQIDEALQDAKDILEIAPEDARANSLMAAVQFRLGNFDEANRYLDQSLASDANNNDALLVKARILIAQKKYPEAIAVVDQGIKIHPDNVSMYLMKIQAYEESGDAEAVNQVYLDLSVNFPDNIAFRHALARNYVQAGEVGKAEAILEQIVADNPANFDEKQRLVSYKYQYRSPEEAIALLKSYIEQDPGEFSLRFNLGELYERSGQADQATAVYEALIEDDGLQPAGLEARSKLALIRLKSGNLDQAKALVAEVLAEDKANEDALLLRAGFKINDRQYDDAIVDLRTILRDNPESIKASGLLGQAYAASGSNELAIEAYTRAFQLSPATAAVANPLAGLLMRTNKARQADEILQQSIKKGNRTLDALKVLTQIKLALGEWDEAERLAQELKKVEGEEALSEQVMGLIFLRRDQPEEGIDAFKRAHELDPDNARPVVALVQTYVKNNKISDAERFLRSVLAENADNVTAYMLLGQLSMVENKPDKAIEHFERVIEIAPDRDLGYRSLSAVYLRQNRLDEAEAVVLRGLGAIPDNNMLAITLASIYERRGQFDQAIGTYEALLEKNPELIIARNNLASLLTDYRNDAESHNRARQMAAEFKDSSVPQFRDTYAWAAVKSGINVEEAVVILEGIVEDNAQIGVYHYHLGEAYRKKGDTDNATASLEKAVSLERPGSDIANKASQALQQLN